MDPLNKSLPLIRLMVAGAAKSGTTSLIRYLAKHPQVCSHHVGEMGYFHKDSEYKQGFEYALDRYFPCWRPESEPVLFAKNVNIFYVPTAVRRLFQHNPDVHLVLLLRNPVDRTYSDYWYARRRGWEYLETFEAALEAPIGRFGDNRALQRACAYLDRSDYLKHLAHLRDQFPQDQIHIFLLEDLKSDPVGICRQIYGLFEELAMSFSPTIESRHNAAGMHRSQVIARITSTRTVLPGLKRVIRGLLPDQTVDRIRDAITRLNEKNVGVPPMKSSTRQQLIEYFRSQNDELGALLSRDLSHWNE